MSADVMMVATTPYSSRCKSDGPITSIGIRVQVRVIVLVREFHAVLFAWILVAVTNGQSWVREAGDRGHARRTRVRETASMGLLLRLVRVINERGFGIGGVGVIDFIGHMLFENICFG